MLDLPQGIRILCQKVNAPPRLVAHLTLIHDTAVKLVEKIKQNFPEISINEKSVRFGAATHDIGKSIYKNELTEAGNKHESTGEKLLLNLGIKPELARFARTHADWQNDESKLEDLLVALADKCWKGKRVEKLENSAAEIIAAKTERETWEVFILLDDIINEIAKDTDRRLVYQDKFSI